MDKRQTLGTSAKKGYKRSKPKAIYGITDIEVRVEILNFSLPIFLNNKR